MASQDHVFVKIGLLHNKPDSLAVARTNRKGVSLASFSDSVTVGEGFSDLILRMKKDILSGQSKEYIVVAHYSEVERTILKKQYHDDDEVFEGRMWISTSQLLWPMVDCQMIPSVAFDTVCKYFDIARDDDASSESDCTSLARIFFELMRRYRAALLVEEGVRDFGGETFDRVRKMIGI